jgi:carbon-monoxide dehydrogenase medium subunit
MHPFSYRRPTSLADAVAILATQGSAARPLAGGTDLLIRLRDGTLTPEIVVDVKAIPELRGPIRTYADRLVIPAGTTMADIAGDASVRAWFPALVEAAQVVGAVQIRNRATLAGNLCNASPAADTAPPLLVHGATVLTAGPDGGRSIPLDAFFVGPGETALRRGELVTAVELPLPAPGTGAAYQRRTRRRGHDLASVTLCCLVETTGITRLAYGSVGPRPILAVDDTGVLADPRSPAIARAAVFDRLFAPATPSPTSMRAGPDYRLAMLRVLGERALATAIQRSRTAAA